MTNDFGSAEHIVSRWLWQTENSWHWIFWKSNASQAQTVGTVLCYEDSGQRKSEYAYCISSCRNCFLSSVEDICFCEFRWDIPFFDEYILGLADMQNLYYFKSIYFQKLIFIKIAIKMRGVLLFQRTEQAISTQK